MYGLLCARVAALGSGMVLGYYFFRRGRIDPRTMRNPWPPIGRLGMPKKRPMKDSRPSPLGLELVTCPRFIPPRSTDTLADIFNHDAETFDSLGRWMGLMRCYYTQTARVLITANLMYVVDAHCIQPAQLAMILFASGLRTRALLEPF